MTTIQVAQRSETLFQRGFCCAESVLQAIAESRGIQSELIPRIATGLCGGIAKTGGICGAVSGGGLAINMVTGRNNADQSTEANVRLVQAFLMAFETKFETTLRAAHRLPPRHAGRPAIFQGEQAAGKELPEVHQGSSRVGQRHPWAAGPESWPCGPMTTEAFQAEANAPEMRMFGGASSILPGSPSRFVSARFRTVGIQPSLPPYRRGQLLPWNLLFS
jgi:C_GCAxxG_C_C family probable redox protein